eukprot:TRINITY_DN11604_c0_g1_i1.p1 TRINITY_DN11604_c0_g1~~TRINITY_DN11604_c0_g1_i1.p1  ORF type:complete len:123 (+),score=12.45 TRINITY_DN11604_c0_g1_i1:3-371(+)
MDGDASTHAPRRRTNSAPPVFCTQKIKECRKLCIDPGAVIDAMRGNAALVTRHKNGMQLLLFVVSHGTTHHVTELIDELTPVLVNLMFKSESRYFLFRLINAIRTPYQVRTFTHPLKKMILR